MALTSKKVGVIIAVIVLSLSGLVALQSMLLNYAMALKEQAFHRNVMTALGQISAKVITNEVLAEVVTLSLTGDSTRQITTRVFVDEADSCDTVKRGSLSGTPKAVGESGVDPPAVHPSEGKVVSSIESAQNVVVARCDPASGGDSILIDVFLPTSKYDVPTDSVTRAIKTGYGMPGAEWCGSSPDSARWRLIAALVDNLAQGQFEPIETRLDSLNLDSIIAASLDGSGIDLEYAYGVVTGRNDSLRIARPKKYADLIRDSEYRTRLFPLDIMSEPADLLLYFPSRRGYIWGQIIPLLASTAILMLIITACFGFTIRIILDQRRFSGLMVNFINNMTHEFKTPISTIALAAEAIKRPDVLEHKDKVLHFNEMIVAENRRMHSQTNKILQMAILEDRSRELQLTEVDLHEVIRSAVETIALHVERHGGKVTCYLEATKHVLLADRVHLSNIVHNILDNASKYSLQAPQITVRTFDSDRGVGFRIVDQGVGLRPEDRKQAFDKYFRVPSGNRHDIKGFGLGLAYVKLMVEAHGGTVTLNSEYGKGAEVEVIVPLNPEGDDK